MTWQHGFEKIKYFFVGKKKLGIELHGAWSHPFGSHFEASKGPFTRPISESNFTLIY